MLTQSFLASFSEFSQLSLVLPLIALLFRFKRFNRQFWILGSLLVVATIVSYSAYLLYKNRANNMYLLHIYTIFDYVLWSIFYYQLFEKRIIKRVILSLIIIFITFSIFNSILWQPLTMYNSYSRSVEGAFLLCIAIAWFYKVFVNGTIAKLETHPVFWINAGVLIYFSGSFLLFISNNFLLELSHQEFFQAWALHGLFLMIHYIFIAIGIWLIRQK
jgi:hypothetical protein